jgi:aspartate carbamoyltransferase catalytic subunit
MVNAGDGAHEHPTQALLDCLTIRDHKGSFEGLKVTIVGDIAHSRVARSNILALGKLGAEVRVAAPATMLQPGLEELGAQVYMNVEEAIEGVDVVMMLRIQKERFGGESLFANTREYARTFGLNRKRVGLIAPDGIVMHPGPMNRGVEIEPEVADGERSVILEQVTNGVAVRMAVLYLLAGGSPEEVKQ